MVKVLITGITGFVGSHLADYLHAKEEVKIYGTIRWRSRMENIEHIKDKLELVECDIRDSSSVKQLVDKVRPDRIFHLAAQSFVPTSWNAPAETLITNIIGELNILEAVMGLGIDTKIHIAGSSEEYGLISQDEFPVKETNPLRPLSPYAVSKVTQDLLGYQYYKSYGLKIVRTRGFNHTGPRRGEVFVTSNFAKQIAEIEANKKEPIIFVGNLDAKRDFIDVRDMVNGYWLALERGKPGEVYNICSGKAWAIHELLAILLSLSDVKVKIEPDPKRMRPSDVPILYGDCSKFRRDTGWQPEIPIHQTLADLLDYWRQRV